MDKTSQIYLDNFKRKAVLCIQIAIYTEKLRKVLYAEDIEELRPRLLEAAQLQIDQANSAYKQVYELVQSR